MVRAGVVAHPQEWPYSGWTESLAVGGEDFEKGTQDVLRVRAIGRSIIEDGVNYPFILRGT
jgi:hypothetical protein